MSIWTHVNGCIRIDGIPQIDGRHEHWYRDVLGNTVSYDDPDDAWEKCNVPKGSEGSLHYHLVQAGGGLVLWTVPVWGDLRDFDKSQVHEIKEWFERVVARSDLTIRDAVLTIHTEGQNSITLVSEEDEQGNITVVEK
jgi:hypothetical protein